MTGPVQISVWVLAPICVLAALGLYFAVGRPLWRWFWDQRAQRVVDAVNPHLQLKLSPFTLTRRRVLADRLANDALVQEVVVAEAERRGVSTAIVQKEAYRLAFRMVPAFNPFFYFKLGHWLARTALRALYSIRIGFADRDGLEMMNDDASVIFFVSHRTNVDYVLVTYLTAEHTMLSFGVGEWSHIWPIQPMMRAAGGYFIHRSNEDPVYRRLLERYVQLATEARVPHAIFPEGALSPDGRLQPAKLGLLSYITRNWDPVSSPDILLVPIGTNYDRVPEDINMISRDPAEFREKGRAFVYRSGASISGRVLWETVRGRKFYGSACAQFGTPISFKEWLRQHWVDWTELDRAERYNLLGQLAEELMGNVAELIPAPPVALLAATLRKVDGPIDKAGLKVAFADTTRIVAQHGGYISFSEEQTPQAFQRALDILTRRHAVDMNVVGDILARPSGEPLLNYYAATIEHFLGS